MGRHGLVRGSEFGGKGRIDLTPGQQRQLTDLREHLPAGLATRFATAGLNVKIENAVGGAGLIEALNATSQPPPDPPNTVTLAFTENGVCMHVNQLEPALAQQVSDATAQLVADRGWGQPGGNPNEYVVLRANRGQGFATTRSRCPDPEAPCAFVGDDKGGPCGTQRTRPGQGRRRHRRRAQDRQGDRQATGAATWPHRAGRDTRRRCQAAGRSHRRSCRRTRVHTSRRRR